MLLVSACSRYQSLTGPPLTAPDRAMKSIKRQPPASTMRETRLKMPSGVLLESGTLLVWNTARTASHVDNNEMRRKLGFGKLHVSNVGRNEQLLRALHCCCSCSTAKSR